MPGRPNQRGGKSYKKTKQADGGTGGLIPRFDEADDDGSQTYARVLRMLGDRRVLCFCNDGNERICKIRGLLCKRGPSRQFIEVGDIVCVSFREFLNRREVENSAPPAAAADAVATSGALTVASGTGRKEVADIVGKYDRAHWREIKRLPNIHRRLFSDGAADDGGVGDGYDALFGQAEEKEGGAGAGDGSDSESSVDIDAI
jgi:initiation factor 1A